MCKSSRVYAAMKPGGQDSAKQCRSFARLFSMQWRKFAICKANDWRGVRTEMEKENNGNMETRLP